MSGGTIRDWLAAIGMERHAEAFEANGVEPALLPDLTNDDLKDLGVDRLADRKRILKAIAELDPPETPAATTPTPDSAIDPADEPPPAAPSSAERRQLTVLFCDLVGSTGLAEGLDPEELRGVLGRYREAVDGVVGRYGGHVAQHLGDGVMAYFGWPVAYEDDAERAIHAGLEAVDAVAGLAAPVGLAARVGIATGLVVVGEGVDAAGELAVGETPNLAARVQAFAEPRQVVTGERTLRLVGSVFATESLGVHALKGLSAPIELFRITGRGGAETRFEARSAALRPIVGREGELALLVERWAQAKEGEGQMVLLAGEAGIGKSRLVRALRERIENEDHIRLGWQGSPYHGGIALHPVIEHLKRAGDLAAASSDEAKLDRLEALLAEGGGDVAAAAPLAAALLGIPAPRYPRLDLALAQPVD